MTIPNRWQWWMVLAAAVAPCGLEAQDYCIPDALGVPYLTSPFPKWRPDPFTAANFPDQMKRLDDPRWRGALSHVLNGEVEFRALYLKTLSTTEPDSLYLSWYAKIDDALDVNADQILLAVKQAGSNPKFLIRVQLNQAQATVVEASPPPGGTPDLVKVEAYRYVGGWQKLGTPGNPAVPSWIKGTTRGWSQPSPPRWAFQMVLPISSSTPTAGLDLADSFEMWYAIVVKKGVTVRTATPYPWPDFFSFTVTADGSSFTSPDPNLTWAHVHLGSPAGVTCAGDVELSPLQIGTENTDPHHIEFTKPPASQNLDTNVFFVRPKNIRPMGSPNLPTGSIDARIFIMNWGSQIDDATIWQEIKTTDPTDVQHNTGDITPGQVAGPGSPRNDIHFRWGMPVGERCMYLPVSDPAHCTPQRDEHQCMLVQLSSSAASPTPLVFKNQSVYRNMRFVSTMSPFRDTAEISVVGLAPIADGRGTRDVYLYVETVNMPRHAPSTAAVADTVVLPGKDTVFVAWTDTTLRHEWGVIRLEQGDSAVIPTKDTIILSGETQADRMAALRRAAEGGMLSVGDVDAHAPTYRVHAYHTTGDTIVENGEKLAVLAPQTSFGYWVSHRGEIVGWRHRLDGEHLVKVGPNFYRIEVPDNGTTTVTTTIEALGPTRFALSLHAGVSLPHGSFDTSHNAGFGITADAEYWWHPRYAVAALLGYHRFGGEAANPDLDIFHASAALEARVTTGSPSIRVDAGVGAYNFSPGSTVPGIHGGVAVEFDVSPTVSLGATGRVHTVFTSGSNTTFSSLQAGGWIKF